MVRLVIAIALVATIYMHSPERPADGLLARLPAWSGAVEAEVAASALRSAGAGASTLGREAGRLLAGEALRRTLTETAAPPGPPPR